MRQLRVGARSEARYQDLAAEFVVDDQSSPRHGELILQVGGRWDRKRREWSDEPARSCVRFGIHSGQIEVVEWFALWLEAYMLGDAVALAIYSILLLGGTRSGKTWIGLRLFVAFTIAVPGCRAWAVQEVDPDRSEELETELDELLPDGWFTKIGHRYRSAHGATIRIRSANHPAKLKRGRCDIAFLNEAQNVTENAHAMLRMRTADTGGLVINAANPPNDNEAGEWVATYAQECRAGRRPHAKLFHFRPAAKGSNPHVTAEQLAALEDEMDPHAYAIEVLGEVRPPSNAVMHAFDLVANVQPTPEIGVADVTAEFLARCGLGKGATHFVGLDFQRAPYMAGAIGRAFENPGDPRRPVLHYVDEVLVDLGDEYDLSDGLYAAGLNPRTTVLIADASGDWQGSDTAGMHGTKTKRRKGNNSWDILRECGWRRIHRPDKLSKANPPVHERMKNDNRLFHSQSGAHLVVIDPKCERLIECCKKWRRRNGYPDKGSDHAHIGDAMSYPNFRLYPRAFKRGRPKWKTLAARSRPGQLRSL